MVLSRSVHRAGDVIGVLIENERKRKDEKSEVGSNR